MHHVVKNANSARRFGPDRMSQQRNAITTTVRWNSDRSPPRSINSTTASGSTPIAVTHLDNRDIGPVSARHRTKHKSGLDKYHCVIGSTYARLHHFRRLRICGDLSNTPGCRYETVFKFRIPKLKYNRRKIETAGNINSQPCSFRSYLILSVTLPILEDWPELPIIA